MHDFNFDIGAKVNTIQISFDILNVGNLINSSWGVRKLPRTMTPITMNALDANNEPWFQFDTNMKDSYVDDFSVLSKWQIQFGLRYIFN